MHTIKQPECQLKKQAMRRRSCCQVRQVVSVACAEMRRGREASVYTAGMSKESWTFSWIGGSQDDTHSWELCARSLTIDRVEIGQAVRLTFVLVLRIYSIE